MSANDEQLQIIVRAVDEATQTLKAVHGLVTQLGGGAEDAATKTGKLSSALSSLSQIGIGFLRQMGVDLFSFLTSAIGDLLNAIPQAVEAGYQWAAQIYQLHVE